MGYRDITVDGTAYKYTVGRTHVKLPGMQAVPKEVVGHMEDVCCDCCGEPLRVLYEPLDRDNPDPNEFKTLQVHPSDIANYIRKNVPA